LSVIRLRESKVELSIADLVQEALNVGLDHPADHTPQKHLDSKHAKELGFGPTVELGRVRVDELENHECHDESEQGLEKGDSEVRPVLELVHCSDAKVEPGDG